MTDLPMTMSVNVHRPVVQEGVLSVYRQQSGEPDELVISLGSGHGYAGHVTLFTSDQGWQAIVDAVEAFRATEERITETDLADPERTALTQWFACEECGHATEVIEGVASGEAMWCRDCWSLY